MRKTYRVHSNKDYWARRWEKIPVDLPQENLETYPLKYALEAAKEKSLRILEAGCGNGRVLRFFKDRGYEIEGFDYIDAAVRALLESDPELKVRTEDVTRLSYKAECFDCVLAFGLYHNLEEEGLHKAIKETNRIMKKGGRLCASFRADNLQNLINDALAKKAFRKQSDSELKFHKMNLRSKELTQAFEKGGFSITRIRPVENMPILYKSRFFRTARHKSFDESLGRREGYLLSPLGHLFQKI